MLYETGGKYYRDGTEITQDEYSERVEAIHVEQPDPTEMEDPIDEMENLKQQVADLQQQNIMLVECLLEISEIVYE